MAVTNSESRISDFIGRQQEMADLNSALDDALAGRGRLIMLAGEPGIGKTRIAQELVATARSKGARVLWGWCYEREGAPPYWPWLQSFRSYVDETPSEQLGQEMGPGASDIAEILPELLTKIDGLERSPSSDPEQARFRLFFSIATFLKSASQNQPMVLVLDDLHWADRPSLLLLKFLGLEIGTSPILVVGTYRDVEVTGRHPLAETLGALVREDHFARISLTGLSPQEVGELFESKTGLEAQQNAVDALHQRTKGNPLFVGEVVGSVTPGEIEEDHTWVERIPDVVRDAITRRISKLSDQCATLLDTASVVGRQFDFGLLRELSPGITEDAVADSLDEALAIQIIEVLPERAGHYRFSHALVQQAIYEEISPTRKLRAHAAAGEVLERLYQADPNEHAAELAHHFAEAGSVSETAKVVRYSLIAGARALGAFGYEQAIVHFNRVITAKEGQPVDAESAASLYGLGHALAATLPRDRLGEAYGSLISAFDYYASVGDTDHIVSIAEFPIVALSEHGIPAGMLVTRALELVKEDSIHAARLHSYHGYVQGLDQGDYPSARESFDRALTIARREADTALEMRTLSFAAHVELWHLHVEKSRESSLRTIELAVAASDPRGEVGARYWACMCARSLGDIPEAHHHALAALEPAERLRNRYWLATARYTVGLPLGMEGSWDAARTANQQGLDMLPTDPRVLMNRVLIEAETGDREQAEVHLERLELLVSQSQVGPTTANASLALASSVARSIFGTVNQPKAGESAITAVLSSPSATPFFAHYARIGASLLAVENGDAEAATEHYIAMKPSAGVIVVYAVTDRILGLLAATIGNQDDSVAHFEDAYTFCSERGCLPELAWTCHDYAGMLIRRNGPGDRGKAGVLLEEGLSIATKLGMPPLAGKIAALQAQVGSAPSKSPANPGGLTQREVEVLIQICGGKTDREIGEELFISVKTVGNHVSNILNKTNTANRTEAATYAAQNGITVNVIPDTS